MLALGMYKSSPSSSSSAAAATEHHHHQQQQPSIITIVLCLVVKIPLHTCTLLGAMYTISSA